MRHPAQSRINDLLRVLALKLSNSLKEPLWVVVMVRKEIATTLTHFIDERVGL